MTPEGPQQRCGPPFFLCLRAELVPGSLLSSLHSLPGAAPDRDRVFAVSQQGDEGANSSRWHSEAGKLREARP